VGNNGDTITVTITPSGASAETITYTKASSETTVDDIAYKIAKLISSQSIYMIAVSDGADVVMEARFGGESFTVNVAVTGNISVTPSGSLTPVVTASYGNGLHFELSSGVQNGVIEKANEIWKGTVQSSGTAQWFRIVSADDTGASSTTAIRIQGICGTLADSPLKFAGTTTLTSGTELSILSFSISI
jgi:hypothetical protein